MPALQNPLRDLPSKMGIEDEPLPPPAHIARLIPAFSEHGEHRCGHHRHDRNKKNVAKYLERYGDYTDSAIWKVACSNCHCRVRLNQIHDLPCGEIICRDCLNVKAFNVKLSIEKSRDEILKVREERKRLEALFVRTSELTEEHKEKFVRSHADLCRKMLRLAGLMCCDVDMQLERFMSCMTPAVSQDLWLATKWLSDPLNLQRMCGWPDCRAYVPVCCIYKCPGDGLRWHCVTCEGNSMGWSSSLEKDQIRFPFFPRRWPVLAPAR